MTLYRDRDDKRWLIDGRNRLVAIELAGLSVLNAEGDDIDECWRGQELGPGTDPYAFVLAANANRRYLSTEQKRDLIRRVLAVRPTLSNWQLARLIGVSGPTAAAVCAGQRSTAKALQLNTEGADGTLRSATCEAAEPKREATAEIAQTASLSVLMVLAGTISVAITQEVLATWCDPDPADDRVLGLTHVSNGRKACATMIFGYLGRQIIHSSHEREEVRWIDDRPPARKLC